MSTYPQLGNASMGSPAGVAARVRQLERQMKAAKVAGGKIEDGGLSGGKLEDGGVTGGKIANGSIGTSHIVTGAITAELITAGAINAGHIQANVITAGHIAANTITAGQIAANTITAGQIAATTITAAQIAANTITAAKIAANTITATQIAADTITAGQIAADAITTSELAANSVTSDKIVAGTIVASDIAATTITGSLIAAATITATNIAASTITGSLIASATIAGTNLISETITATQIAAGAITTPKLVSTAIDGMTITGSIVRSGATGARWQGDTTGIRGYNSAGEVTFAFDNSTGKVTTIAGVGGPNLVTNSSFEHTPTSSTATGWSVNAGTFSFPVPTTALPAKHGSKYARVTATAASAGPFIPVADRPMATPGISYTASGWVRPIDVARTARVEIEFYNSGGTSVGVSTQNFTTTLNTWTRIDRTMVAPATASHVRIFINMQSSVSGERFDFDSMQIEEGSILTAYSPKPDEILPGTVGSTEIQDGSVRGGGNEIATTSITANDIVSNTITAGQIAGLTITGEKIAGLTITGGKMVAGTITANEIATGTITATQIASATITSDRIASRTIAADRIQAHVISAYEINATSGGGNLIDNASLGAGITTGTSGNMALGTADTYAVVTVNEPQFDKAIRATLVSNNSPHVYFGFTSTGSTWTNRAVAGRRYSASAYFKSSVSRTCRVGMQFANSAGTLLTVTNTNPEASGSGSTTIFRDFSSTTTGFLRSPELWGEAPAGTEYVRMYTQAISAVTGETHDFGGVQLEEGDLRTAFSANRAQGTFTGQVFRTDIPGRDRYELTNSGLVKIKADNVTKPVELGLTDGLDILQGVSDLVPPTDRQLRWKNATEATATIYSILDSPGIKDTPSLIIRSTTTVLDKEVKALLGAYNNNATSRGEVSIQCNWAPADANATLIARAEAQQVTVLAADGKSDLIQAKGAGLAAIRGLISSAGAVVEGTGFTVVRNSVGNYTVTYTTASVFNADATPIVSAFSTAAATQATAHVYARSATAFSYVTVVSGARADVAATFAVFGPVKPL